MTMKDLPASMRPRANYTIVGCIVFTAVACLTLNRSLRAQSSPRTTGNPQSKPTLLELGKPIEREIRGGENHSYKIHAEAGQFVHVVVLQEGIDVLVALFDSSGKQVLDVDSPNGSYGPEPVSFIAEDSGDLLFEVSPSSGDTQPGHYQIQLTDLRAPRESDQTRIKAERTFMDGGLLYSKGGAESLKTAAAKWEESSTLWQSMDDKYGQAFSLSSIGLVYSHLGEKQKALDYYNQAPPLRRGVEHRLGDPFSEAASNVSGVPAFGQQASTKTKKPNTGKTRKKISRMPTIADIRVGYIDGAIIGSQVRFRFDAAFGDNASDRAEFFYAQYAGINGPGPSSVVADLNFQQLYLNAEYAPKKNTRFSFFGEVPVRWIQPQRTVANADPNLVPPFANVNSAGSGDIAAGFKLAAVASSNQYLTFQFKAYFPSGNASTGLGTNHYSFEPALLYYRKFSDRFTLEAQVGDSHPIGGSSCPTISPTSTNPTAVCIADAPPPPLSGSNSSFAGDVLFYGVGPSYVLYKGKTVQIAPVIELVGWSVLGGLFTDNTTATPTFQQAVSASGINIVTLKVGARTSIGKHNSFYIGGGYAVTHSRWYRDILRVEYRYSF
jgi:outer membrane putative beta-barrel porin/alpha-amylase